VFVIELHTRRVRVVGATRYPDEAFVLQAMCDLIDGVDGVIGPGRVLICDRDRGCNAYTERFVQSIKEECLARLLVLGERHLRVPSRSSWHITTPSETTKASVTDSAARALSGIRSRAATGADGTAC